jgi:hypothetical protein
MVQCSNDFSTFHPPNKRLFVGPVDRGPVFENQQQRRTGYSSIAARGQGVDSNCLAIA